MPLWRRPWSTPICQGTACPTIFAFPAGLAHGPEVRSTALLGKASKSGASRRSEGTARLGTFKATVNPIAARRVHPLLTMGAMKKKKRSTFRVVNDDRYGALVRAVVARGDFLPELAEKYIVAVIATLEEHLSFADVSDLEAELPSALRETLHREPLLDLPTMDDRELFHRVRTRLRVTQEEAEFITRIVLQALRASIPPEEAARIDADLAPSLQPLWRA